MEWAQVASKTASGEANPTRLGEPASHRSRACYGQEKFGWLQQRADLLRAGRLDEIDRVSLIKFLTDMALTHRDAFQGAMTVLLHHMLKVLVQPERTTRSWLLTIRVQQRHFRILIEGNPGLRQYLPDLYVEAYSDARGDAFAETGVEMSRFPQDNPWTMDEALSFVPPGPPPHGRKVMRRR